MLALLIKLSLIRLCSIWSPRASAQLQAGHSGLVNVCPYIGEWGRPQGWGLWLDPQNHDRRMGFRGYEGHSLGTLSSGPFTHQRSLSPPSMDGRGQEHAGGGQRRSTGQTGYGLSWERTACPGEGQPHISELSGNLGIVCFSRIPMTGKVNVGVQGGAAHHRMAQSQASARAGLAGRRPGF